LVLKMCDSNMHGDRIKMEVIVRRKYDGKLNTENERKGKSSWRVSDNLYTRYCPLRGQPHGFVVILQAQLLVIYVTMLCARQTTSRVSQPLFHGKAPTLIFRIPKNLLPLKMFTGTKCWQRARSSIAAHLLSSPVCKWLLYKSAYTVA
jgi:hypothetical protein